MADQTTLHRLRAAALRISRSLRRLRRYLEPTRIDKVLLEHRGAGLDVPPTSDFQLTITKLSALSPSGFPFVDNSLHSRWCYLATIDNRIVHRSFVGFARLIPQQFGFARHAPVIGDCFTLPDCRGYGIKSVVLHRMVSDLLRNTELDRVYALVGSDNFALLRGAAAAGFTAVARLTGLRVMGILWSRHIDCEFGRDGVALSPESSSVESLHAR